MRRYLLDTGPAGDVLFNRKNIRSRISDLRRGGAKIGIGLPTLGELIAGLENSAERDKYWAEAHHSLGHFTHWPFDEDAAYQFGRISAELTSRGRVIQQVDRQLAAIAMTLPRCVLITYDTDFDVIPRLDYENWRA